MLAGTHADEWLVCAGLAVVWASVLPARRAWLQSAALALLALCAAEMARALWARWRPPPPKLPK